MENDHTGRKWVPLPNTYKGWSALKDDLESLEGEVRGVEALEVILKRHDRWGNVELPLGVVRRVLERGDHFTAYLFNDTTLPWLASKALQVQELFQSFECRLPVSVHVS